MGTAHSLPRRSRRRGECPGRSHGRRRPLGRARSGGPRAACPGARSRPSRGMKKPGVHVRGGPGDMHSGRPAVAPAACWRTRPRDLEEHHAKTGDKEVAVPGFEGVGLGVGLDIGDPSGKGGRGALPGARQKRRGDVGGEDEPGGAHALRQGQGSFRLRRSQFPARALPVSECAFQQDGVDGGEGCIERLLPVDPFSTGSVGPVGGLGRCGDGGWRRFSSVIGCSCRGEAAV